MKPFSRSACRIAFSGVIAFRALAPGLCSPPDPGADKKFSDLRARAEQGYVDKQIELAAAYLVGRGVPQDTAEAAHWYLKAAASGSPEAQNEVGYFYQVGIGVPTDAERAVHWFQLASAGGMARAKVNLGVSYLYGTGVRKNPAMARQLFDEAVQKGSGLGATYLGLMAYFGLGGAVDKDAAAHWFETGAKMHDPEAAYDLALLFAAPEGRRHDLHRAVELLRFSAEKGYVAAKHALGMMLVNHPEIVQADGEARRVLQEASEAGNWKATVLLGILARDGKLVPADPSQAYYYFHLACLQNAPQAESLVKADIDALKRKLSPEQQSVAAGQAENWFQQHRTPLTFVAKEGDAERFFPLVAASDPGLRP